LLTEVFMPEIRHAFDVRGKLINEEDQSYFLQTGLISEEEFLDAYKNQNLLQVLIDRGIECLPLNLELLVDSLEDDAWEFIDQIGIALGVRDLESSLREETKAESVILDYLNVVYHSKIKTESGLIKHGNYEYSIGQDKPEGLYKTGESEPIPEDEAKKLYGKNVFMGVVRAATSEIIHEEITNGLILVEEYEFSLLDDTSPIRVEPFLNIEFDISDPEFKLESLEEEAFYLLRNVKSKITSLFLTIGPNPDANPVLSQANSTYIGLLRYLSKDFDFIVSPDLTNLFGKNNIPYKTELLE